MLLQRHRKLRAAESEDQVVAALAEEKAEQLKEVEPAPVPVADPVSDEPAKSKKDKPVKS